MTREEMIKAGAKVLRKDCGGGNSYEVLSEDMLIAVGAIDPLPPAPAKTPGTVIAEWYHGAPRLRDSGELAQRIDAALAERGARHAMELEDLREQCALRAEDWRRGDERGNVVELIRLVPLTTEAK